MLAGIGDEETHPILLPAGRAPVPTRLARRAAERQRPTSPQRHTAGSGSRLSRDLATGLELAGEISRLAQAAGHHADLNLRAGVLEVRLVTTAHWSRTEADRSQASQISAAQESSGSAPIRITRGPGTALWQPVTQW